MFVLEFKLPTDREEGILKVKEAAANEQHSSIIEVLRALSMNGQLSRSIS